MNLFLAHCHSVVLPTPIKYTLCTSQFTTKSNSKNHLQPTIMKCSLLIFLEVKSCFAGQKLRWRNLITWAIFTIKILPKFKIQGSIQLLSSNKVDMFISLSCHEFCLSNDSNTIILKHIYHYKFTIQIESVFFRHCQNVNLQSFIFPVALIVLLNISSNQKHFLRKK